MAIFYHETDGSLFFNTLSVTPITVEVHQDTVSSDGAASACLARQTTLMASMRDSPCQISFTVTLATTTSTLGPQVAG